MREMVDEDEPDMLLLNLFCLSGIGIKVLPRVGESRLEDRGDDDGEEEEYFCSGAVPLWSHQDVERFSRCVGWFPLCVSV